MSDVDVLPDVVLMARTWLVGAAAGELVDGRVATRSQGVRPEIVLQRIGGVPADRRRLDVGRIQVDVFAETEGEASLIARTARADLHGMEGQFVVDAVDERLGFVTAVNDDLPLTWAPDALRSGGSSSGATPRPRFTFGVAIYAHAT